MTTVIAERCLQRRALGRDVLPGDTLDVNPDEAARLVGIGAARYPARPAAPPQGAVIAPDPEPPLPSTKAEDLIALLATATLAQVLEIEEGEQARSRPRASVLAAAEARIAALDVADEIDDDTADETDDDADEATS